MSPLATPKPVYYGTLVPPSPGGEDVENPSIKTQGTLGHVLSAAPHSCDVSRQELEQARQC